MDEKLLRNYARLIVRSGINVQPGQEVIIRAEPEQTDFIAEVIEECYIAGASRVSMEWLFSKAQRFHVRYQSDELLGEVPDYEELKLKRRTETLPAFIWLDSEDPDALDGVDTEKLARAKRAKYAVTEKYDDMMDNRYQWCIAAMPGEKWAQQVFPGLPRDEAEEKLWEAILRCSRAMNDDPAAAWRAHDEALHRRCQWLNSLSLTRLIYKSASTGTDLSVGLMPESRFLGGCDVLPGNGVRYNANIPSEEVFTSPRRGDAEGMVYGTRPLCYRGVLIDGFSIRFEGGRVSEVHAAKGEEELRRMVGMDEGAAMLGECALVPYSSPIRESGILFYNTLFDENAACHLALGEGFANCCEGFETLSLAQLRERGLNHSMIHEDFMIGSADLSITGIRADGSRVAIFENGDWAQP